MFMWVDEYTRRDAGVNLSTSQGLKKRNHAERKDLFIHKWHILNNDYILKVIKHAERIWTT